MLINFQYRTCRALFDCEVGRIDFPPDAARPQFEHYPVCPDCGERTLGKVALTEAGQGQLTVALLNP